MADRSVPYGAFNYVVKFDNEDIKGGFSDVSGLGTELNIAEYREGTDKLNQVRKVAGTHKVTDVTLKRGIVSSEDMWNWIKDVQRNGNSGMKAAVVITLRDEAGNDVQSWKLRNVLPMKYTGPTLAAKGGGDVAMEELVLSIEAFDIQV